MPQTSRAPAHDAAPDIDRLREDFVEKAGFIAQAEGLPRIAGRIFGLLTFDGEAVAFGDLADRLQVSRGSVSSATRMLEDRRLIRRLGRPGQRGDFFQIAANPFVNMLETVATGLDRAQGEIEGTLALLPDDDLDRRARLARYAGFYRAMGEAVRSSADRM